MMNTETLRRSFMPKTMKILFVGESEPAGGDFFYKGQGIVYGQFKKVLLPYVGDQPNFLTAFKNAGFYLDDLVLKPINYDTKAERKKLHSESVPDLAKRLSKYKPDILICFMKAVEDSVRQAASMSVPDCEVYAVPFPAFGQQGRFRQQLGELMIRIDRGDLA